MHTIYKVKKKLQKWHIRNIKYCINILKMCATSNGNIKHNQI